MFKLKRFIKRWTRSEQKILFFLYVLIFALGNLLVAIVYPGVNRVAELWRGYEAIGGEEMLWLIPWILLYLAFSMGYSNEKTER